MQSLSPTRRRSAAHEEGFLLIAMVFMVAVLLIFLAVAAPIVAKDLQREREIEMIHRANQYVRAIRVYYRTTKGQYPTSIDQLLKSNNVRYLRQAYADPMTGKPDWRLIHVGENKTKVTGFFGEPLDSMNATGGGISGASNLTGGGGPAMGTNPTSTAPGNNGAPGSTGGFGSPASNDATTFNGGGGPIIGVSSLSNKTSIITVHGMNTYNTWEFLYDPLIEKLYNSSQLTGGGGGLNGGLGSVNSMNGTGSNPNNTGTSNTNGTSTGFGSGSSTFGSGSSTFGGSSGSSMNPSTP